MKIAVTGASGLVGKAFCSLVEKSGWKVTRFTRDKELGSKDGYGYWSPDSSEIELSKLEGLDAVVHLAGESIVALRWNEEKKRKIRDSRVSGTKLISSSLAQLAHKPKSFLCASAIGFYGDTGIVMATEGSPKGEGFLSDVAADWESASADAMRAGIRVVNTRIGIVLSTEGGALKTMLPPFKVGMGGALGKGDQYMSWITLDDLVRAMKFLLENDALSGPVNLVAPHPVINKEFTKTLASVLGKPAVANVPAIAVKTLLGEMAQELLLCSTRVACNRLVGSGFEFEHPQLEEALGSLLVN